MNGPQGTRAPIPHPISSLDNKHHEWEMVFFFPLAHVNSWRNASKGECLRSKLDSSRSFMPPSGLFRSLVSVAALVVLSPLTTFKPTVTTFVSATTCFFLDYFSSVPVLVDSSRILNPLKSIRHSAVKRMALKAPYPGFRLLDFVTPVITRPQTVPFGGDAIWVWVLEWDMALKTDSYQWLIMDRTNPIGEPIWCQFLYL